MTREQLLELERAFLARIRSASKDGSLLRSARLLPVLSLWREKAGEEEVRAWVTEGARNDSQLVEIA